MASRRRRIQRWDPTTLKPTNTILVVGKRNTGKSVIMRNILYHLHQKLDAAVCFTPTEGAQGAFAEFVPPSMIHEEFDATVLDAAMNTQRKHWKRGHGSNVMVVLDDVAYDKRVFNSKPIRSLFMNGRHNRCGCILSVQYSLDFPVDLRSNCDYIIACREQILSNRERLYKHFFGQFASLDSFNKAFSACTNNYEVMVLKNDVQSNDIEDCVFWWKAELDLPRFRVGAEAMWPLHEQCFVDDDDANEAAPHVDARMC